MTDKRPLYDPDERIFTLADVRKLFKNQRKKIVRATWIGALLAFGGAIFTTTPKYQIHATFKEGGGKSSTDLGSLSNLFGSLTGGGSESQTIEVIQSFQVLKPLVERLGLQAVVPAKSGRISRIYKKVRDNLLAQRGRPLKDIDWFVFRDVKYKGDKVLSYSLRFEDLSHFSILSEKKIVASGSLGTPVTFPEVELTIIKTPQNLRRGVSYPLIIQPWINGVQIIRSQLRIATSSTMKSIFDLNVYNRDRHFGTDLVNELMTEYRNYLKRDHDDAVKEQLVYLEQKQEEICGKMAKVFDEYTGYLQNNLSRTGQLGLRQEIEGITKACSHLDNKIFSIDLELDRLSRVQKDRKALFSLDSNPNFRAAQEILGAISDLKQQRDLIEVSLPSSKQPYSESEYQNRKAELKGIRDRIGAMRNLLDRIDDGSLPIHEPLFDPTTSLGAWAARLDDSHKEEREDLAEYLENYVRLLSMQEKIVQERMFYGTEIPSEFQGIDLNMARSLFIDYNDKFDQASTEMGYLSRLSEEICHNDFEISSLSTVLSDPLSSRLIDQASDIALKLKDEKYRSEKEGDRWSEELSLQKKILKDHLEQLYKVASLKSEMFQDKISSLQTISLACISGQISVLEERITDFVKERKAALITEKNVLGEKLKQMRGSFQDFPDKWRREKWLTMKSQMGVKMVQVLTELVETKTITSHLHQIESKPLDLATLPTVPIHPGLWLKAFFGAILAGFATFSLSFLRTLMSGFPTSREKLVAMRYPTVGQISSFCDGVLNEPLAGGDLEALRQISLFLDKPPQPKVIGIIEGKGPDYSYALGEHLARMSLRPLVVRCDFNVKFNLQDQPGLLQVWKKETVNLPIRMKNGCHFLSSGGYTPYGAEVVQSKQFQELLSQMKKDYDCVLLVFRAPLDSMESVSPLTLCDKAIVTVSNEPTEQLTPFIDWAYHEGMCRLSFLTASSG